MATKKPTRRPAAAPRDAVKNIIYASDTSATSAPSRRSRMQATTASISDFSRSEDYELEPRIDRDPATQDSAGETVLKWIKEHWAIITFIVTAIAGSIVWATRIEGKVEVLAGHTTEIRGAVDKLKSDSVRTSTQVEQLQRSMGRMEDQQFSKKR